MRTAVVAAAVLLVPVTACSDDGPPSRVSITLHHSTYRPGALTVSRGRPVTIVLRNDDPIAHEWIVGDEAVHARHRTGTEPAHDERPTEVTVPALSEKTTVVTFAAAGELRFVCHLPGHEAYGMSGVLRVV